MANRAIYISAQGPGRLMRELLEIMRNDEDNNHLSLSCMKAMERYLVATLHQSSLPVSLLDEIRAADDRAVQQARQFEAPRGNRGVFREMSNAIQMPLTDRDENHMRVPRDITRSFLVTRYDSSIDEPRPVHHKPLPAPTNTRGSSSTEKASSVGTLKENRLPRDVHRAFYMADDEGDTVVDESLLAHHQPPAAPNERGSSSTEKASSAGTPEKNGLPRDVNQAFYVADEDEPPRSSPPSLAQTLIEQASAPKRNRRVLGEISNVPLVPVIGPGEGHLGAPRNIDQSFYVAEDDEPVIDKSLPVTAPDEICSGRPLNTNQSFYIAEVDPVIDESPPVPHEPPQTPPNPHAQPSIRQPTRVSESKANPQQNVASTLRPTQNDQPYRRIIANANHDATITLEELEQSFVEETGTADDGSETEEATSPDTSPDASTARAPHVFENIPKIVVTDSRENIQAIVQVGPNDAAQPTEATPKVPEYNFLRQKKAGFYNRAANEPQRLYPTTLVEEREKLPPSWSARQMGTSQRPARPAYSSPPIQRAGSAPVAATKGTKTAKGKQAGSVEPTTTSAGLLRRVETRASTGKRARGAEAQTPTAKRLRKTGGERKDF